MQRIGMIYLWLGESCNARCRKCWAQHPPRKHVWAGDMPTDKAIELLRRYRPVGVNLTSYGEPFVHAGIGEIIVECERLGIEVHACSNGALIRQSGQVDSIARTPGFLTVSCDSADAELHDWMQPGAAFDAVDEAVRAITTHPSRHPGRQVYLNLVASKMNVHDLNKTMEWAQDVGFGLVNVIRAYGMDKTPAAGQELLHDDPRVIAAIAFGRGLGLTVADNFSHVDALHAPPAPGCDLVMIWVNPDGSTHACCFSSGQQLGNVFQEDVWNGAKVRRLSEQLAARCVDAKEFPACAACPRVQPVKTAKE